MADTPGGAKGSKPSPEPEDWELALREKAQPGLSPELARKLLSMNPALRDRGADTASLVAEAQKARSGIRPPSAGNAQPAPNQDAATDGLAAVDALKQAFTDTNKQLDLEQKRIQEERSSNISRTLDAFHQWLRDNDPQLRSPFTQQLLSDEKRFLDALGFSVKAYMDWLRKNPTRG